MEKIWLKSYPRCVTANSPVATAFGGTVGLPLPSTEVSIRDEADRAIESARGAAARFGSAALYEGWKSRTAKWTPIPLCRSALPRHTAGRRLTLRVLSREPAAAHANLSDLLGHCVGEALRVR